MNIEIFLIGFVFFGLCLLASLIGKWLGEKGQRDE
jgi:hypothetical protein